MKKWLSSKIVLEIHFLYLQHIEPLRMVSHPHYHPQRQELHQQAEQEGMEIGRAHV